MLGDLRGQDWPTRHVSVDASGFVYVAGSTTERGRADACFLAKYRPDGTPAWLKVSPERPCSVAGLALDSLGGVYMAGSVGVGRIVGLDYDWMVLKLDGNGGRQWVRYWDGNAAGDTSFATAIAANDSGVVVAGTSARRATPSSTTLTLRRYDSAGAPVWETTSGQRGDTPSIVKLDAAGRVTVAGGGGGPAFVARHDSTGALSWLRTLPSTGLSLPAMAADETGSVWLAVADVGKSIVAKWNLDGQEAWRTTLDGVNTVSDLAVKDGAAVLVGTRVLAGPQPGTAVRLDANGAVNWSHTWPDATPYVVALTSSGSAIAAGWRTNGSDFAFWVAACEPAGDVLWERSFDAPGNLDGASAIALALDGSIHVGGMSKGTTTDATTLKYAADGALSWVVKEPPASRPDRPRSMAAHGDGAVTVAVSGITGAGAWLRRYSNGGDLVWARAAPEFYLLAEDGFGGIVGAGLVRNADDDVIVERYDLFGNRVWSRLIAAGAGSNDYLAGMAVDRAGNVLVSWSGDSYTATPKRFLSKYDRNGSLLWTHEVASIGLIAVDDEGFVITVGVALDSVSHRDILVARLSSDGAHALEPDLERTR